MNKLKGLATVCVSACMIAAVFPAQSNAQENRGLVDVTVKDTEDFGCKKEKPDNSKYTIEYPSAEYETLQDAVDAAKPGTTILIKGIVEERVRIENDGITLKSNGFAVLRGNKSMKNGGGLIEIAGKDIVIEDIELTNLYTFDPFQEDCADGIRVEGGASNVHILNCVVHHIGCIYGDYKYSEERENFNAHGISVKGEKDAMITDVVIKGCEVYKLTTGQSESVVVNDNVEHFTVADNYIHDNDNIGIDLAGGFNGQHETDRARLGEVCGNRIENNSCYYFENAGYIEDDGEPGCGSDGIYVDGGVNIWIHDNFVSHCDIGLEISSENHGWTAEGIIAENNVFVNNDLCGGILVGSQDPDENGIARNNIVRNNTVINSDERCLYLNVGENNTVENNIFICDSSPIAGEYIDDNSVENNASNMSSELPGENLDIKIDTDKDIDVNNKKGTADLDVSGDVSGYGADTSDYSREEKTCGEQIKDLCNKLRRIMMDPRG